MNPPPNNIVVFGFLQKDVPEAEETLAQSPMSPSQFFSSPTAPALGLNFLNAPRLPGFAGDDGRPFRTYQKAKFYDAPTLSSDAHADFGMRRLDKRLEAATIMGHDTSDKQQSVRREVGNSNQVNPRPLRRRHALRGEFSDDGDHSDCSTTAVRGTGVRHKLRRSSVRFWPYQAIQRQNRDALHRSRSHNYSTTAQAGSPPQSFYDRGLSSLSPGGTVNQEVVNPFGLRHPLSFVPLALSHNPLQTPPEPSNAILPTHGRAAPPVPGSTPRVFAEAGVQTNDAGNSPIPSNVSNAQPMSGGNPRKRSRDNDQAEGSPAARPLTRRRTSLGSGEVVPSTLLRRSGSISMA